jgi:branched-chain amino acid transport system substrate-binding protein
MTIMGGLLRAGFVGAAFFFVAGSAQSDESGISDTEILLGQAGPLTGPAALLGLSDQIGVKIAVEEVNAAGGINGRKVRYIYEDDAYQTPRTIQAVRKLLDVDKVFAMTGLSGSGQTLAVLPMLEKEGVPTVITVAPVEPVWQPPKNNIFVVGQSYKQGVRELVRYLSQKYPDKRWGLITQDDDYGYYVREGFDAGVKESKINVVFSANFRKGQQDFSAEILRLKEANVEIFIAAGIITENVAMMKELEKLNIKPITGIFWVGRIEPVIRLMGPISDGMYVVDYVDSLAMPGGQEFIKKAKQYVSEAELKSIHRYTFTSYTGARVLFEAMRRCGKNLTRECTIAELEKTKDFESGVMTPITFGPGVRFSNQKLQVLQVDFSTLSFKPVN